MMPYERADLRFALLIDGTCARQPAGTALSPIPLFLRRREPVAIPAEPDFDVLVQAPAVRTAPWM